MPGRVVPVAAGLEGGVEVDGVLEALVALVGQQRGQVAAAAEPAPRGADEAGVHVHRRHARAAHVGDQRHAGGEEAGILIRAGDGPGHLGGEGPVDDRGVDANLLEEPAVHHAHDAAPARLAHPGLALEPPRRARIQVGRRLVLEGFESGVNAVAQGLEPFTGAGLAVFQEVGVGHGRRFTALSPCVHEARKPIFPTWSVEKGRSAH